MRHFGGPTLKRTCVWANSRAVRHLSMGKILKRQRVNVQHRLAESYIAKSTGRKAYRGNKKLRGSQILGFAKQHFRFFVPALFHSNSFVIACMIILLLRVYPCGFGMGLATIYADLLAERETFESCSQAR